MDGICALLAATGWQRHPGNSLRHKHRFSDSAPMPGLTCYRKTSFEADWNSKWSDIIRNRAGHPVIRGGTERNHSPPYCGPKGRPGLDEHLMALLPASWPSSPPTESLECCGLLRETASCGSLLQASGGSPGPPKPCDSVSYAYVRASLATATPRTLLMWTFARSGWLRKPGCLNDNRDNSSLWTLASNMLPVAAIRGHQDASDLCGCGLLRAKHGVMLANQPGLHLPIYRIIPASRRCDSAVDFSGGRPDQRFTQLSATRLDPIP